MLFLKQSSIFLLLVLLFGLCHLSNAFFLRGSRKHFAKTLESKETPLIPYWIKTPTYGKDFPELVIPTPINPPAAPVGGLALFSGYPPAAIPPPPPPPMPPPVLQSV